MCISSIMIKHENNIGNMFIKNAQSQCNTEMKSIYIELLNSYPKNRADRRRYKKNESNTYLDI